MTEPSSSHNQALLHFRAAKSRADMERIVARLRGRSADLIPFEEVRRYLGEPDDRRSELREIPIDSIIGSVGRYNDFTRSFLPRDNQISGRWTGVDAASAVTKLPPIHLYQVGDAYFVLDGNHRVSVAREHGATQIDAYVTEVPTPVPLSPEDNINDFLVKAERAEFLALTGLDQTRPGSDFAVTEFGSYQDLLHDIGARWDELRGAAGDQSGGEAVTAASAAADWHDAIYQPAVAEIERRGMLREFPGRTTTDLYAWLIRYRREVEQVLGWQPEADLALDKLIERYSPMPGRMLDRARQRIRESVVPGLLESGPGPGRWREYWAATHRDDRLFSSILVGVDGTQRGWDAADQAWYVAQREEGRVHGLHIVDLEIQTDDAKAKVLQSEFTRRSDRVNVPGRLSVEQGDVEDKIVNRARWADLVVLPLNHPPAETGLARLGNGFRSVLHRCPRPLLAVPGAPVAFQHALLAFDGSRKAYEALFVAAYLATHWRLRLTVTGIVGARGVTTHTLHQAVDYLLDASVPHAVVTLGAGADNPASVGAAIVHALETSGADLLIMGSYGKAPLFGLMAGSAVDEMLRQSEAVPILFCR